MDYGIVDAASAESAACGSFPGSAGVLGKDIKGQGMGQGIDFTDSLVKRVIGLNLQDRPEYFFLHHFVLEGYIVHDGGFDL